MVWKSIEADCLSFKLSSEPSCPELPKSKYFILPSLIDFNIVILVIYKKSLYSSTVERNTVNILIDVRFILEA